MIFFCAIKNRTCVRSSVSFYSIKCLTSDAGMLVCDITSSSANAVQESIQYRCVPKERTNRNAPPRRIALKYCRKGEIICVLSLMAEKDEQIL